MNSNGKKMDGSKVLMQLVLQKKTEKQTVWFEYRFNEDTPEALGWELISTLCLQESLYQSIVKQIRILQSKSLCYLEQIGALPHFLTWKLRDSLNNTELIHRMR